MLLLIAVILGGLAEAQSGPPFTLESFSWRAEHTPQTAVVAANDWGDLRVRTSAGRGLVVSAMIQKIGAARDEFRIRVDERADRVAVAVVPLVARPRGRVDLTLMIPAGKRVDATTRDGLAEVKYSGEVRTRTRAGAIAIETPSAVTAHTRSGTITAKLTGRARRPLSFTSGSGDITIWLPEHSSFALRAGTRGAIEVDFPYKASGGSEKVIGEGGARLRVRSASGNVRIRPYPASAAGRASEQAAVR